MSTPATAPAIDFDTLDQGFTDPDAQSANEGRSVLEALKRGEPEGDTAEKYVDDEDETDAPESEGVEDDTDETDDDAEEDDEETTEDAALEAEGTPADPALAFNPTDITTWPDEIAPAVREEWAKQTQYSQALAGRSELLDLLEGVTGGDLATLTETLKTLQANPEAYVPQAAQDAPQTAPQAQQAPPVTEDALYAADGQLNRLEAHRQAVEAADWFDETDTAYVTLLAQIEDRKERVLERHETKQQRAAWEERNQQEQQRAHYQALQNDLQTLGQDPLFADYLAAPQNRQSVLAYAAQRGLSVEQAAWALGGKTLVSQMERRAAEERKRGQAEGRRGKEQGSKASLPRGRTSGASNVRETPPEHIASDSHKLVKWLEQRGRL